MDLPSLQIVDTLEQALLDNTGTRQTWTDTGTVGSSTTSGSAFCLLTAANSTNASAMSETDISAINSAISDAVLPKLLLLHARSTAGLDDTDVAEYQNFSHDRLVRICAASALDNLVELSRLTDDRAQPSTSSTVCVGDRTVAELGVTDALLSCLVSASSLAMCAL